MPYKKNPPSGFFFLSQKFVTVEDSLQNEMLSNLFLQTTNLILQTMPYHISKPILMDFDEVYALVVEKLKEQSFGVITEVDVKKTMQEKIGEEFRPYKILGVCNPRLAYEALTTDDKVGLLLPCNVVIQDHEDGTVEVSAINPLEAMKVAENPDLERIGQQAFEKLTAVINAL
jgi:uncharacterized protein (DUF302 family)